MTLQPRPICSAYYPAYPETVGLEAVSSPTRAAHQPRHTCQPRRGEYLRERLSLGQTAHSSAFLVSRSTRIVSPRCLPFESVQMQKLDRGRPQRRLAIETDGKRSRRRSTSDLDPNSTGRGAGSCWGTGKVSRALRFEVVMILMDRLSQTNSDWYHLSTCRGCRKISYKLAQRRPASWLGSSRSTRLEERRIDEGESY